MVELPKQLKQHKDKIIYLGLATGGLLATAIKLDFVTLEQVKGLAFWIILTVSVLGLWTFQEGFIKLRKKKRSISGQGLTQVPEPNLADLGATPPLQQVSPQNIPPRPGGQNISPIPAQQNQPPPQEDIFAEFNQH